MFRRTLINLVLVLTMLLALGLSAVSVPLRQLRRS